LAGTISRASSAIVISAETPAQISPFFSWPDNVMVSWSSWVIAPLPSQVPRRGSTTYWLTSVPTIAGRTVEAIMNQQFIARFIPSAYSGSTVAAASMVSSPSITSVPESKKFALKPAETPAKPAAMPASGWRPIATKIIAANGARTPQTAADDTAETAPDNTTA